MLIGKPPDIPSSAITSRDEYDRYINRRRFLRSAASTALAAGAAAVGAERLADILSPRASALAVTKSLARACGKTTVPMSRPSSTAPGPSPKPRWNASNAARTP